MITFEAEDNMTTEQQLVRQWMQAGGQECPLQPVYPGRLVSILRVNLIQEELEELELAFASWPLHAENNIERYHTEVADAIADLLVVVLGTAVACGLDLEPIFLEVMRSNYTKLVRDGENKLTCVKNLEGKIMKPASYEAPKLLPIVEHQISNPLSP